MEEIAQAIINSIDGYDIWVEASSYMHFEWEDTSASYISHELDNDHEGLVKIRVVSIKDETIVLKVGAAVEANFNFSVRYSIDKDYVGMGGNVCTTTETYHTDILLTLSDDLSGDFDDIEVLETIEHADFGEVEPDWTSEHEDEDL